MTTPPPSPDEAELSRRRLALIVAYAKDPTSEAIFADRPAFYRLLVQERAYQQALAQRFTAECDAARARGDESALAELEAALATALNRQAKVFKFMKDLTGVHGRSGGTGVLTRVPRPPLAPAVRKVVTGQNQGPGMAFSPAARSIDVPLTQVPVPKPEIQGSFAELLGSEPPCNT